MWWKRGNKNNEKSGKLRITGNPLSSEEMTARIFELETKLSRLEDDVGAVAGVAGRSIHKTGFLRFNPFQDMGGDNSFVLVLLDAEDSGVILTALYTREGMRLYGKQIEKGMAKYVLTNEEKEILEETMHRHL